MNIKNFWMNLVHFELTELSKLKAVSTSNGHSKPHLHVPSFSKYSLMSSVVLSSIPLGLKLNIKLEMIV